MSNRDAILALKESLCEQIIGQAHLVDRLLIAILADGHLLVEGAPGLAKTKAIKALATGLEGDFHRIQFTPDLLPADVTGTEIYRPQDSSFVFQPGPIFHNLVLADEINRAPAKVQSALLEAMAERQISVGKLTHPLPPLFLVMATQNPIEQEGTYPLPEAQLDRFLMHVTIDYPDAASEKKILQLARMEAMDKQHPEDSTADPIHITQQQIFAARAEVIELHMIQDIEEYIVQFTMATRNPLAYGDDLSSWIEYGVSPRGTIALDACARAHAWLNDRDFVTPEDVQAVAHDTLRHRIGLTFEAEAKGITADHIIDELIDRVSAP
ncbi:MAG: AAA family ATPase [Pseudomonadales bacterium]|jgi:MoxR-like ATPase|uniref:AAA family ATPase n=1 Tax=unclassified Ketobacter TaxID=2639109 RepID=UPI000C392C67|nr:MULTISPECIES: MoxR family ATPase [unclassified Ketobacter]MAA60711.1 AAA family ATPase [Pseudomonadales bacterium]MEC8810702.1 MoxR family ATPase [Pseudomonadota bacterium]TNC88862.1 MAG: AAA family ATPase [Alcanivorax sp.]HAG92731.1 AAA family ATPase [Gammaproteobacteria bacterium]MAQ27523.1 AAA family ATPase [Pseudomonadales bacterium]|tara:strand:+ start:1575 stop:2549 length:975 start_codon:yes stop_codon:yes gene_type:complete